MEHANLMLLELFWPEIEQIQYFALCPNTLKIYKTVNM